MHLDAEQRQTVADIARERGFSCYFCRATEAKASGPVRAGTGGFNIAVKCAKCGDGSGVVTLERDEAARRLGLRLERRPYTLQDTSGSGRAPMGR